ncbi:putative THIF-type NAD/FAD binding, ubiquitin-activating enzyme E1 [Helianthus annuus]|nr:putative THIF-type NAD/FAD binding, ubiquitin-activating enzyme E1 [Helianthus annuus]
MCNTHEGEIVFSPYSLKIHIKEKILYIITRALFFPVSIPLQNPNFSSTPSCNNSKLKFIAGWIIPAIATTTAMATGFVCLELYKVLNEGHKVEDYRNTYVNLATPLFSMAEPVPPKVIKHQDLSWTVWDRWILRDNLTLGELLLQWLESKGLKVFIISFGSYFLYNMEIGWRRW